MRPPVIADKRNVDYVPGRYQLPAAQEEIEILRTVEFRPQPADFFHQRAADDGQVVRVVVREGHFRAPVPLELRVETATGIVDFVLVCIQVARRRVAGDGLRDVQERVVGQHVVMIDQRDKIARRHREG